MQRADGSLDQIERGRREIASTLKRLAGFRTDTLALIKHRNE
jgi:hypothetical protein